MGCWVVPAVAAELWGVPLERVMDAVRDGTVFWKNDEGFLLIDADPRNASALRQPGPRQPHPPTYTAVVTPDEIAALIGDAPASSEPAADSDCESGRLSWQTARQQAARARHAPQQTH